MVALEFTYNAERRRGIVVANGPDWINLEMLPIGTVPPKRPFSRFNISRIESDVIIEDKGGKRIIAPIEIEDNL